MSTTARERGGKKPGPRSGLRRRELLTAAGIATAAAGLPREALGEEVPDGDEAIGDPTRLPYRETEHVRWFYSRARM